MSGFTDAFYKSNREKYDPDVVDQAGSDDDEPNETATQDGEEAMGDKVPRIKNNTLPEKPSYVEYSGHPDVWFNPQEVWECVFADITLSPTYTAAIGLVSDERGLSLRFPRFLKVREDKSMEEASDAEFLASLWRKQEAKGKKEDKVEDAMEEDDEGLYDE
jgi:DNA ligase 1